MKTRDCTAKKDHLMLLAVDISQEVHHIYAVDTDLGSSIFFNDVSPCDSKVVVPSKCKKD